MAESDNLYKKLKSSHRELNSASDEKQTEQAAGTSSSKGSYSVAEEKREMSKCQFEIRRWRPGSYTLITDDDGEIKTKALDLMVFFSDKSSSKWSLECGGHVSYIARNEDTEVKTTKIFLSKFIIGMCFFTDLFYF